VSATQQIVERICVSADRCGRTHSRVPNAALAPITHARVQRRVPDAKRASKGPRGELVDLWFSPASWGCSPPQLVSAMCSRNLAVALLSAIQSSAP